MTYISKKRPDGPERFVALVESVTGMDIGIIFSPYRMVDYETIIYPHDPGHYK